MYSRLLAVGCVAVLSACNSSEHLTNVAKNAVNTVRTDNARTLYVSATAAAGGDGSLNQPFNSLQSLEAASMPGDTLVVLPSPLETAPLNGGIALKPNQRLVGDGPDVVMQQNNAAVSGASVLNALPRIQNTQLMRLNGDAVRLAEGSEVRNLVITAAARGGIYGLNAPGARIHGNDVSGTNTTCFIGFTVEPFVAPTRLPYFGIPLTLPAGWAAIMVDADSGRGALSVTDNFVHDTACGNGIDLRINGTADYSAEISGNFVTQLKKGPGGETQEAHLVHAITIQITDSANLIANSANNTETFIGGPGSDCEGLFMNLSGTATSVWTITRNTFEHGIGGFSCNGMEQVVSNGSPRGEMYLSNSTFVDNPGDMLQQDNLGRGSTLILEIDRILVRDTTERGGSAEAAPLPFNLGECILTGSTGTDNTTVLRVRDSDFSNCNSGLTLLSGVSLSNGLGPDGLIDVDIRRSRFRNNAFNNLILGVITPLRELRIRIEDSDFGISDGTAVAFKQVDLGSVESAMIDLGGGALGSHGGNCLLGGATFDAESEALEVFARGNWWGNAAGPAADKIAQSNGGTIDFADALTSVPAICR